MSQVIEWHLLPPPEQLPEEPPAASLVCVPFAGAGPLAYRDWSADLPGVRVVSAYLPGRERRFREPAQGDVNALVPDVSGLLRVLEGPYAVFGHSLGSLIAFELCRALRRAGAAPPTALIVSGCRAPGLPASRITFDLPDAAFEQALEELGGTPPEVRSSPELMELLLPVLRADFKAAQTYRRSPEPPLDFPIHAFCGDADTGVDIAEMRAWEQETTGRFKLIVLPGDHFFIGPHRPAILSVIRALLTARPVRAPQR